MNEHNIFATKPVQKLDADGNILAEYASAKKAAEAEHISYRYIMACIQRGALCHGMRFMYAEKKKKEFTVPQKVTEYGFHAKHNPYLVYCG